MPNSCAMHPGRGDHEFLCIFSLGIFVGIVINLWGCHLSCANVIRDQEGPSVIATVTAMEEIRETIFQASKCFGGIIIFWSVAVNGALTTMQTYVILAAVVSLKEIPSVTVIKALISLILMAFCNLFTLSITNSSVLRRSKSLIILYVLLQYVLVSLGKRENAHVLFKILLLLHQRWS